MKYKYIATLSNNIIWGKNEITRDHLSMVKDGRYDFLIDVENGKWFNAEENKWEDIKGDSYGDALIQSKFDDEQIGAIPLLKDFIKREISTAISDERGKIRKAIELGIRYGQIDGSHHKMWTIDQMIRILAGEKYDEIITESKKGEDGDNTYNWDIGIAP